MISSRLQMIFTKDEMSRLTIHEQEADSIKIIADVHGMKCKSAKVFIKNIVNATQAQSQIDIIHGYNHGTAIKDMLANDFDNPHVIRQYIDPYNQGLTHMLITA